MKKNERLSESLNFRIISYVLLLLILFSGLVGYIGYARFTTSMTSAYSDTMLKTAETAAVTVTPDRLDDYLKSGGTDADYEFTNELLDMLCQKQDFTFIYVFCVDTSDYNHYTIVFNVANDNSGYAEDDIWTIGHVQPTRDEEYRSIYRAFYENGLSHKTILRTTNLKGAEPHIHTMIPLKGSDGSVKGILTVQSNMDELNHGRYSYLQLIAAALVFCSMIASIAAHFYFGRHIVHPIKTIARETRRFADENTSSPEGTLDNLSDIGEIRTLADSIDEMEQDTLRYIENLTRITSERERILTELSLAKRIQASMLPSEYPPFPDRKEFDIFGSMQPAKEVGGDFYDYFLVSENQLGMVIADVSGKGIPAALFMMVSKILVQNTVLAGMSPATALEAVNEQLCKHNPEEMFVTVWLGILDLENGVINAANAGHEYPMLKTPGGQYEVVHDKHGFVIGGMECLRYKEYQITLEPGSSLFLYTDGVPEACDQSYQQFGLERTLEVLNKTPDASPVQLLHDVEDAVRTFTGDAPLFDDMTMLCIQYHGPKIPAPVRTETG
ncbi:MAG: SpoIIE family protein phosphatase [Stomatobaculum sp.]|nr:SpoIIE family protein phosphatase [Stomatobaculum sp.]